MQEIRRFKPSPSFSGSPSSQRQVCVLARQKI